VDVADLMERDSGQDLSELRVDGGASANDLLCQFQADLLGVDVVRPEVQETTVMGAAYLAGLAAGVWASTDELQQAWQPDARFSPTMDRPTRDRLLKGWHAAVQRSTGWAHIVED
jgi:glycerol kinase